MSHEPPLAELRPSFRPNVPSPAAYAEAVTARSGTSFGAGMAILPKLRREGMRAIYAFCRIVDDIADGDFPPADKSAALTEWRDEIKALYVGSAGSLLSEALAPAIEAYDLPVEEFDLIIEGMEMDAAGPIIAPTRERLAAYTRRAAGAVGMLSMRVFGAWQGEASGRFALALGDALQLTNILRDVETDAEIGRLYLPREVLEAHGVPTDDPQAAASHPSLPEVCREIGTAARACYDTARSLAGSHPRHALRPALLMMGAYEGYLDRMEAMNWVRTPNALTISKTAKLWRGAKYALLGPGRPDTAA